MTQPETARVNELIGIRIGIVQQAARNLRGDGELQEVECGIAALEKAIAELKDTLAGIAHRA